jgi:hypothetical protein
MRREDNNGKFEPRRHGDTEMMRKTRNGNGFG